ncbi:ATP-binding cassette domain-containing protein [Streptomyces clavuligerus]|uniref:Abc transporter n=1 Tax=Streptomyces clavuligerus TaxID=1901 RepID=B5GS04_STRCL|nr:ABC transporter ATP-binding protein [Streptomyces clavuligerus]EDY49100.1 conserved hypothetical protein [Streptomyces clavuligerus]EFG03797.1 Abc transporter [Streptomyces clavuligerus]MBY6307672.1 ABC transporter ATP-binding protein [Streptomyces clavuligerus]QCS09781.1 ABC transporter ATP-binding protein [Streptomyces clavuligerus]QPJ98177.1 ATP-binding cassette domain-containing protein [Streptomyces clavuligerus]
MSRMDDGLGRDTFWAFLNRVSGRFRGLYLSAMGIWTVIHGLPLIIGLVTARLIDGADEAVDSTVWWLLGLTVGLMVLRAAVLMGGLRLTFTLIFRISSWIKVQVLGQVLRTPSWRSTARGDGDILNRLREDTDEIGGLLEWSTDLIYRSVLLVAAIAVLVSTDPVMTLPLVLLLGGLWASVHLKRRVGALREDIRAQQGEISATVTDVLTGIRDVRLSDTVEGRLRALDRRFAARRATQVRHQIYADLTSDLFRITVMVGTAAVLLIVSVRIANGEFSIGKLVLFLTYIAWLGEQMFFFGYILARVQSGRVSYGRLSGLVGTAAAAGMPAAAAEPLTELKVTGLTRAPGPGTTASPPVSFTVRPGQLVAITGEVGSGKSTLVRGLLGLGTDVRGSVRWNGREIAGDAAYFRAPRVGYARQSPRFLRGTVSENLALGSSDVTTEQMERALAAVRLAPGSSGLPAGLDTLLDSGEARQISGGQRQRLALARMLCRPAQVYVVDDCDSSLDAPTARLIWETLPAQWPGAWIVVSHNPDLLAMADVVVTVVREPETGPPPAEPVPADAC